MSMKYQSDKRRWEVIADFIKAQGFRNFVEVGCKEGKLCGYLAKNIKYLMVYAIDPWRPMPEQEGKDGGETYADWDFAKIEEEFKANTATGSVRFYRKTSLEAVEELNGLPLDLVFIDAAHNFENVVTDIQAWYPLIRNGGFLMGHDYQHKFPSVMRAVARCFPLLHVGVMPDSVWMVQKSALLDATGIPAIPGVPQ